MTEFYEFILHLITTFYETLIEFIPNLIAAAIVFYGIGKGWLMDIQLPYLRYVNRWLIALGNWMERTFGKKKELS